MTRSLLRGIAAAALTGLALSAASTAGAASPAPSSARAAREATQLAKDVLIRLEGRGAQGNGGTVTLHQIGATRTRIRVQFFSNPAGRPLSLALIRGSDCMENRNAANAAAIALNPFNTQTQMSQTIVNLPLTNLRSGNYLVQVQDATARSQIVRACARLNR